jgi:hypothetical protein
VGDNYEQLTADIPKPQAAPSPRPLLTSGSRPTGSDVSITSPVEHIQQDYFLTDFDIFGADFNIDDVDLEAAVLDSTRDFWANFPGEVQIF